MYPGDIPDVLQKLNATEVKLISQVQPYMQMQFLPAGGQQGLKGHSINIPIPFQDICSSLPKDKTNSLMKVYSAKSDSYHEVVNIQHVDAALLWL